MTPNHEDSKRTREISWKLTSIIGIPVTALITWVFFAGGVVNDVKVTQKDIVEIKSQLSTMDNRVRTLELGLARIEVQYKQILDTLSEIKYSLKKTN